MKQNHYSLLSLAIFSVCYSSEALADLKSQCLMGVPHFQGELVKTEQLSLPITIEADKAVINQSTDATYLGNVSIQQGNRHIQTEQVRLEQSAHNRRAYLKGGFDYQDNFVQLKGNDGEVNLLNKDGKFSQADYHFVDRQGRGTAEEAVFGDDIRVLKNASFTSCLDSDNAWSIDAKEMRQYVKEEYAEMWHARFKVMGVPIFYTPYVQLPIGDRRRSGLLMPNLASSSRDGLIYSQPIYWNIAPNMDATFTPTYYSRRGWQLSPEVRYLTQLGQGLVAGEYLQHDRLTSWSEQNKSRHLFYWRHNVSFLSDWRFSVDYTRVSDKRYFSDFDSGYGNKTDGYATQSFKLGYYQPHYNIALSGKKFQTFDNIEIGPYRVFPQIDFNYFKNNIYQNGDFKFYAQLARFENDSETMPTATRVHLEPSFNLPLVNRYGSLNFETKLYATHYWQQQGKGNNAEPIKSQVNRVLPQLKLEFKTLLEADKQFIKGFSQILEPRIQYLYRPYKDQSNIGSKQNSSFLGLGYDSALLQQDYFSLFRDRRYSGLDRIASANQVTLGATTRFFKDKAGEERFNLSIGQIYYLSPSRIDDKSLNSTADRSSSWALESNWKFHPKWNWRASYQYDTRLHESSLANMSLQFNPKENSLIQLNYRYASKNYIDQNLQAGSNRYNQDIKQIGGVVAWELTDHIAVMAGHYQDLALKKPVETQVGVNYNTCCWGISVFAGRQLIATPLGKPDGPNNVYYENRFGINFELRGLGTNYNSGITRLLKRGIIPYTDSFNIN